MFLQVVLFMRHFDLKAKVRTTVMVNRFLLSEKSLLENALRSVNDFSTLQSFF